MSISGLLIASGLSSRLDGFKPLLKYKGQTFLITIVEKILSTISNVVIVVGYNHTLILEELADYFNSVPKNKDSHTWIIDSRITILHNENYKSGMFSSLQLGVNQLSYSDWILYHFVDQPNIPIKFYSDILKQHNSSANWVQPIFEGRKGHPILFDKLVATKIIEAENSSNLLELLRDETIEKYFWNCNCPQVLEDIDTNEDYEKVCKNMQ